MLGTKRLLIYNRVNYTVYSRNKEECMEISFKYYSSDMKAKLGFAIVTSLEPQILILDEVFAAGDQSFRKKSEARIKELYQNTTTILVTHSMGIVKDIANRDLNLAQKKSRIGDKKLGKCFNKSFEKTLF